MTQRIDARDTADSATGRLRAGTKAPVRGRPLTLEDLTAPLGTHRFRSEVLGRTYRVFTTGDPDRFRDVFGWDVLNEVLATHRLDTSRLRLIREHELVPEYAYTEPEITRFHQLWQRLRPKALTAQLRAGATMRLRDVDELHAPVRELAAALERELRGRVQVNAYASCHDVPGPPVHRDDHDVLVLQVSGRKLWSVHGVSDPLPLPGDLGPQGEPPAAPVAEFVLEQGEVLYLPRGWWHVARAAAGPSLHLTFGVFRTTGADLLEWLVRAVRASDVVRADVPCFDDEAVQREYLARLREVVVAELADPQLLPRMLADRDAAARPELGFTLPYTALREPTLPKGETVRVRLLARRSVVEADGDDVVLRAGGVTRRYPAAMAPLLETLATGRNLTIADLVAAGHGAVDAAEVRQMILGLLTAGLVVAEGWSG